MGRRSRETQPSGQPGAPGEVHMDVRVTGPAAKVQEQVRTSQDKPEPKPDGNGVDEKAKFLEALRNPKYLAKVKRLTPREFNGRKINFEVFSSELPLSLQDIMEEVGKVNGGGKFRAAVTDPESNTTVAAYVFELDGNPIVLETELTPEEKAMFGEGVEEKTAATLTEEGLERQARLTAKQIEYENLQHQLKEARESRTAGNLKPTGADDARIDALERRLIEAKHAADLERVQREADKKVDELKERLDKLALGGQAAGGASETTLLLQQMQKNQEASDKRFEAMQKQLQDDKMAALMQKVDDLGKRSGEKPGGVLEMVETMAELRKFFKGDDRDSGEDEDDDRPWYEKAIDRLGDKFLPKLLDKFDDMEGSGKKVSREDFMREVEALAKQAEDEAVARAKARIGGLQPAAPIALPPPGGPVASLPPPPPPAPPPPAAVQSLPPPAPPQPPAPEPAAPRVPTVQEEILIRVGGVLEMISREVELQPNEYHWSYEGAWQSLPRPILAKVCAAADPVLMIDAFSMDGVNPETLAALRAKVAGDAGVSAWLKVGLDELKEWWQKKTADPRFDPFEDEDEEDEGE